MHTLLSVETETGLSGKLTSTNSITSNIVTAGADLRPIPVPECMAGGVKNV